MGGEDTAFAIEPAATRREARVLIAAGDDAFSTAEWLRTRAAELQLTRSAPATRTALTDLSSTAWATGALSSLAADAAEAGDTLDPARVGRLAEIAAGMAGPRASAGAPFERAGSSPWGGDLGGTFDRERRSPYVVSGGDREARGRSAVMRALADTARVSQIHPDEFELIRVDDRRFVVVLPGVTDLSHPDVGLSDEHRSVRDLDAAAIRSSRSTGPAGNAYARMVATALRLAGVPTGSELLVVGHSFGADTALDLAADPMVNGERYRITHVVAAGYHSQPQLAAVPAGTDVLVLQNRRDVTIAVERLGQSAPVSAVDAGIRAVGDVVTGDRDGAWGHAGELAARVTDTVGAAGVLAGDLGTLAGDLLRHDRDALDRHLDELWMPEPGVTSDGTNVVVDVFDGRAGGSGHRQADYLEHVATTSEPAVVEFLVAIADAGYTTVGGAVAVDVSVPARPDRR